MGLSEQRLRNRKLEMKAMILGWFRMYYASMTVVIINWVIYEVKTQNISCFQPPNREDLQLFLVSRHGQVDIFEFIQTVSDRIKPSWGYYLQPFYRQNNQLFPKNHNQYKQNDKYQHGGRAREQVYREYPFSLSLYAVDLVWWHLMSWFFFHNIFLTCVCVQVGL